MRIAIRGRRSLDDVRKHLNETLDLLESLGATYTQGANLYLNPCTEAGAKLVFLEGDGKEIETWEIPAPKLASRKAKPPKPGGNVVPFPSR